MTGKIFLDVRSPQEFLEESVSESLNIPHVVIMDNLEQLPKDKEILVYCRTGKRSHLVVEILKKLDYDALNICTVANAKRMQQGG